jgi:hypothetical protein
MSKQLKDKYNESLKLFKKMHSDSPHERPNCEDILEGKSSWALNEDEFQVSDKLQKIIGSKQRKTELTIYSMLRLKINSSSDSSFDSDISLD